ncbi:protein kinase-like domain-containing protein [Xylariomycetidae sp. FL0641]|nr:protein kinase-like domain-containing protein [Xylariomycetidae sp. FL0641]
MYSPSAASPTGRTSPAPRPAIGVAASLFSPSMAENSSFSYCSRADTNTDVSSNTIPEECDEETGSESFNEPVTPASGRESRDFHYRHSQDIYQHRESISDALAASYSNNQEQPGFSAQQVNKAAVNPSVFLPAPAPPLSRHSTASALATATAAAASTALPATPHASVTRTASTTAHDSTPKANQGSAETTESPSRPSHRRNTSSTIRKAMSSLFRRNSSQLPENGAMAIPTQNGTNHSPDPNHNAGSSEGTSIAGAQRPRFASYYRSSVTTRSNTPPSPSSPLDMTLSKKESTGTGFVPSSLPTSQDFFENNKKNRVSTGLTLRQKVGFVTSKAHTPRRTRSLERKKNADQLTRQPWAIPPDAGTGMKARRLSLSLPDDFTVDVADLLKEFEYQHRFLGRHGRHVGKGATSKVTLMVRKGCPGELYAVKEFRGKSSSETADEYEKKIKSEYSIAKSLHHPNVVETIRLCTDHGRWNHVMEYCSEGDLFSLVSKKYLKEEGRETDRLCLFKQMCQGINYLHSHGIAHRDIKLENLLITKESKLKITDFGVSEVFSGIHPGLREAGGQCGIAMGEVRRCKPGICGSLPYIAPEVLRKQSEYDPRALDVWSAAIVMLNLIFGANLWDKAEFGTQKNYNDLATAWEKFEAKKAEKPEELANAYPKVIPFEMFIKPVPLRRLLLNMLHPNPEHRIRMDEVINNRWMKGVECCQLESYDDPVKFIDASKKDCTRGGTGKIFCHNHLPPMSSGHSLPPMPGKPGY